MNERNKEQLIGEIISLAGFVATVVITRKVLNNPDFVRTVRMRTALTVKRVADAQVNVWENIGTRAATSYQKVRM